jgi:hypothetical protein
VINGNSDKMGSCRIAEEAAQQRVLRDEELTKSKDRERERERNKDREINKN